MPEWHAVCSSSPDGAPGLLCRLGAPTACPRCQGGPPCRHGVHLERPVRLLEGSAQAPPSVRVLVPENMDSAGFAQLEAVNYPPGALGAGVAGPVSVGHLVSFSRDLEAQAGRGGALGVVCSRGACANVLLLLGAYLVLARGLSAEEALARLPRTSRQQQRFPAPWARKPTWHAHSLTVRDCLVGLQTAVRSGWLDYGGFDCDEWLRLLTTYDASFTFHLPLAGEAGRLAFYAMADPVTTVADPRVRPAPPEDGFVSDYVSLRQGRRSRSLDEGRRSRSLERSPGDYMSDTPRDLAAASGEAAQRPPGSASLGGGAGASDPEGEGAAAAVSDSAHAVSMPLGSLFRQGGAGGGECGASSDRGQPLASSVALGGAGAAARTDSKVRTSDDPATPTTPSRVTWLETVRVRRWGQEQHGRQSPMPLCLLREHGLTTLPEFGTWLRSVGCRRLVQLNRPDETTMPSTGSYKDYFSQWQLQQEALHFDDGAVPPLQVVRSLRCVVEEVIADMGRAGGHGAVVVHCTAGLGRTGTLLGVLAMEMAGIPGGAWMGWVRMCRPGSVQTLAQERFLKTYRPASEGATSAGAGALRRLLRRVRCAGGGGA